MNFSFVIVVVAFIGASLANGPQRAPYNWCVDELNHYRIKHGVPPLIYKLELASFAFARASNHANQKTLDNLKGNPFGENLAVTRVRSPPLVHPSCKLFVDLWYNTIKGYNFNDPHLSENSAFNFADVVWKSTEYVGCAWELSDNGEIYAVCEFHPRGTVSNPFKDNVFPTLDTTFSSVLAVPDESQLHD